MKFSRETVVRSSGSDRVLVIMAKAPRPGEVKTRLVPSLSPKAVTDFYCCLLDDTLALARSLKLGDGEVAIMCPDTDVTELAQLAGKLTAMTTPIHAEADSFHSHNALLRGRLSGALQGKADANNDAKVK